MKKFQSLICLAAAAMAFTGCSTEDATQDPAPEARKVTLSITADNADTRTVIDGHNRIWWTESDAIQVLEKTTSVESAASTTCTLSESKATFTVTLPAKSASAFTYAAIYPASAFLTDGYNDIDRIKATLPATQTPTADSFDPAADLMISLPVQKTAQPTAEGLMFRFGRVAALAKMTITNLGLAADESVTQVSFAATGKKLAGRCYLDLATGKTGELGYSNSSERIVLDYSAVTGLSAASFPVWFAALPCDLAAGDTFTVVVTTNKNKTYTKSVTLADAQTLSFNSGKLSTFTVNMSGIAGEGTASDASIATLTYDEIKSLNWAYGTSVDYTNAGGTWTIEGSKNSGIQLNSSSSTRNPRIVLPLFTKDITSVQINITTGTGTKEVILSDPSGTQIAAVPNAVGSFYFDLSDKSFKTATITATGGAVLTSVQVTTGAVYAMNNIEDVAAVGVSNATATYKAAAFAGEDDTVVTPDGTVVTAATVDKTTRTVTYTVSGNTTGAAREGSITLTSAANGITLTVKVSQAADVFKADPTTVTLGGDVNATAEITLTSDFAVATPEVSAADKFKIEAGADGIYTVTALADGGDAEAELGTITFTRTIDSKKIVVTVKQAAKGAVGQTEFWKDDFSNCTTSTTAFSMLSGSLADFTGAYSGLTKTYPMDGAIKIGTSKGGGAITTPVLTGIGELPVSLKITFKAEGWNTKTALLTLKVNNGGTVSGESVQTISSSTTMTGNTPSLSQNAPTYTFIVNDATNATTLTFSTSGGAVGMDDLLITTN